jgi:hypothetical protein
MKSGHGDSHGNNTWGGWLGRYHDEIADEHQTKANALER